MIDANQRADVNLFAALAARARRSSDTRLVADGVCGLVAAGAIAWLRPVGWLFLLEASLCVAAFGVWGITARELEERVEGDGPAVYAALRVGRFGAAAVGVIAGCAMILQVVALTLGTWIS
ncbi:MAG TPA: hypothetical protein VII52_11440 [Gemmatimonadaceae bacterium]